jgi:hypothetical protein
MHMENMLPEHGRTQAQFTQRPVFADFKTLLDHAGFRIRGRRADCLHCDGSSRLTVSFNDEVAFCHRCKWTGNLRTLSREFGVPVAPETAQHRESRTRAKQFDQWRATCQRILADRFRDLGLLAERAKQELAVSPNYEPAWTALADFYQNEPSLSGALDLLAFEKLSPWLEEPMTREKLAAIFNSVYAAVGKDLDAA